MTDWKGNIIQAGHNILIVDVQSPFSDCDMVMYSPIDFKEVGRIKGKRDYIWNVSQRVKVTEPSQSIMISFNNNTASEIPVNSLEFMCSCQYWQIICIEGISDNKEEYFTEHFKTC